MRQGEEIFADSIGDDLYVSDTETTVELNLAVLKPKHTVKRKKSKMKINRRPLSERIHAF
jgi:hypothetical protein